jgi:hypothetical protein
MATAQKVEQTRNISPAQRAQFFSQMTRQHLQMRPAVAGAENATVSFNLDKVRLTSRILLLIEGTVTVTHASATSYTAAPFAPFSFIRSVNVEINNGFKPFTVSGREIYWYNLTRAFANQIVPKIDAAANLPTRTRNFLGNTASASGAANPMRMVVELPLTLNERDPIGLILTQNEETVVIVTVSFGAGADLLASGQTGYTVTVSNLTVTPMVESFSIPPVKEAFPDISILKLVQSTKEAVNGAGPFTLKLPVGLTYRKLLIYIEDSNGGVADTAFTGDFQLVLNGADYPYQINPKLLAALNQIQYGQALPQGLYVFDFTYQGLANYGGARDYIDTERLTEFWFKFNATGAGNVTAVYELLSRLRG